MLTSTNHFREYGLRPELLEAPAYSGRWPEGAVGRDHSGGLKQKGEDLVQVTIWSLHAPVFFVGRH